MGANITDIAKRLNLSHSTVSRVLNRRGKQFASEETSRKIWLLAEELNYRPNRLANALLRGKTHVIGVLMGRVEQSHAARLLEGIRHACLDCDYQVLLGRADNDERLESKQARLLLDYKVDGLICVADGWVHEKINHWLDEVVSEELPAVIVDSRAYADRVDCIITDDFLGAKRATQHLIELGHRRIAHLAAGTTRTTAIDRRNGYVAALAEGGIALDPELIQGEAYGDVQALEAMETILSLTPRPTALFAASDGLVFGARTALESRGVRIPEELAIVGYGNLELGEGMGLTTMNQFPLKMGERAVEQIMARMNDRAASPQMIELDTEIIVRRSSGDPVLPTPRG